MLFKTSHYEINFKLNYSITRIYKRKQKKSQNFSDVSYGVKSLPVYIPLGKPLMADVQDIGIGMVSKLIYLTQSHRFVQKPHL